MSDDHTVTELRCEILDLEEKVAELEAALKPFADFNDALKEWRYGPGAYLLQSAWPENQPVLRWREKTPPPYISMPATAEIRMLEVWPHHFAKAEELLRA